MNSDLLTKLEKFKAETGLSDHRVGILTANNGRLLPRLRNGHRVWPDTEAEILERIGAQREVRGLNLKEATP